MYTNDLAFRQTNGHWTGIDQDMGMRSLYRMNMYLVIE